MALDKQAFYSQYAQVAIEQQKRYGIPASITLAQMGLESGFGTSTPVRRSNNFFGVKVGSSWTGAYDYYSDDRPNEKFRRYNNVMESIEDHSKVLMKSRYSHCQNYSPTDYVSWANGIKAGGYATDPDYASKLISEINKYGLGKYDQIGIQQAQSQGLVTGYARGQSSTTSVITLTPLQGNWGLPIDLSVVKLSSEFGVQRPGHKHGGLDLSTQGKNYPVYATEDNGKVVTVGKQDKGAGNYVVIEYDRQDGTKIQTTYMHLNQIGVKPGDIVNARHQIGVSGNTGRSSGPHLHFETKYLNANGNWEKFDPKLYLAEMEVRSNQATALDKNGNDALAAYRSQMLFAGGKAPSYQQQASDPTQALLANGDRAKVMKVSRRIDLYGFHFATLLLKFPDYDNYELEATVLLDTLTSEASALTHDQQEQLFHKIEEDYQDIPLKADRMKAIRQDPYFNALQVKFAYAVTCHKAQGGQWSHVYVDQGYMTDEMLTPDYIHWLYTAFTRATEMLYLVNWPKTQVEGE